MPVDANMMKTWSEIVKNAAEVIAVVGAAWGYVRWQRERQDRSTDELFQLEDRFTKQAIQRGCELIEDDEAYASIRSVLLRRSLPPDSVAGEQRGAHFDMTEEEGNGLAAVDELLRFYI